MPSNPEPIFFHNCLIPAHSRHHATVAQLAQKKVIWNPDRLKLTPLLRRRAQKHLPAKAPQLPYPLALLHKPFLQGGTVIEARKRVLGAHVQFCPETLGKPQQQSQLMRWAERQLPTRTEARQEGLISFALACLLNEIGCCCYGVLTSSSQRVPNGY